MDAKLLIKLQTEKAERLLQEGDDMVCQSRWHHRGTITGGQARCEVFLLGITVTAFP